MMKLSRQPSSLHTLKNTQMKLPLYEIFAQLNSEDNDVADILKLLALQAEENLGMVMIFTLVTAVQEKLNENSRSNKN